MTPWGANSPPAALPYDARVSGGLSLGEWLGAIAAAEPAGEAVTTGYDAFYDADPQAPTETADFEAFQVWLKGLPR